MWWGEFKTIYNFTLYHYVALWCMYASLNWVIIDFMTWISNRIHKKYVTHPCPDFTPPGRNGHHFPDDIFKSNFMHVKFCILIWISLKFVPKGPINNIQALVQIMAWRRSGDMPLSEPMQTRFTDTYIRIYVDLGGDELKSCWAKPLSSLGMHE